MIFTFLHYLIKSFNYTHITTPPVSVHGVTALGNIGFNDGVIGQVKTIGIQMENITKPLTSLKEIVRVFFS